MIIADADSFWKEYPHGSDVGLLCAASTGAIQFDLIRGDTGINWGSILENALAQQLVQTDFRSAILINQKLVR